MLHEIFYCSYAGHPMEEEDILDILKVSRKNNSRAGVTGILLYYPKTRQFMQILEGEKKTIFDLLEVIKQDPRHSALKVIYDGEIEQRSFADWTMAFSRFDSLEKSRLEGFSEFIEKGFTDELISESPTKSRKPFQSI